MTPADMIRENTCSNCTACHPHPDRDGVLECRLNPPQVSFVPMMVGQNLQGPVVQPVPFAAWPNIPANGWCRQHERERPRLVS